MSESSQMFFLRLKISDTIHGTIVYLPIHEWLMFKVNVGNIPYIDAMGMQLSTSCGFLGHGQGHIYKFGELFFFY